MVKKIIFMFAIGILSFLCATAQSDKDTYLDMNMPQHERILDLLSKLTVEEKISLLRATSPGIPRLNINKYYHGNEALHGVVRPGNFTVFPQAIGLAATWNPELLYEISTAISDEARGRWNELEQGKKQLGQFSDLLTFWSPTVNMARDPRWGRTPETYGEDPLLSGKLGVAFVKGLQGDDSRYLKVVSTPKHFAANNEEHNRFECNAIISEKELREYYLPAFEKCVIEGKAASIMTAYNAINDVPCTLNNWLLKKVLREDWGFNGYVVSDCGGPGFLVTHHNYVKTTEAAASLSLKAGLDLECGDNIYIEPLLNAYRQYMVSEAEIDSAAYHVLKARMRLGLFDNPELIPYNKISPSVVGCEKHSALALEAARQSIVLLKNENNLLPLHVDKIKSIAVVGINADNCEFGDYSGTPMNHPISILEGIKKRVDDKVEVMYSPWISSSSGYEMIPNTHFPNGLKAEYYSNKNLVGIPKIRVDENINFEPSNQAPDPFLPNSSLSIRWSGELIPTISGKYTLAFATDDGCRLYLDGEQLLDSWYNRGIRTDSVSVKLEKGKKYQLVAEYFNDGGEATAKLYWHTPEFDKREVIDMYGEAGNIMKQCDLTIAVLGINKSIEREGQDRYTIELPKDQQMFIEEAYRINPNIIVVLVAGSSLAINWIDEHIPAIVNAWYPGEQGGTAVAEVLFGDCNPSGRLPLTYYNSLNELPSFDDYQISKGRTYQYFEGIPLYAFGYGLSYTNFKYDKLVVSEFGENIKVSFTLKNTGKYDGDEVAQLYVRYQSDKLGIKFPLKQLKAFERVYLKKGESKNIVLVIPKNELRFWNEEERKFYTPAGIYQFMVGSASNDIRLQQVLQIKVSN